MKINELVKEVNSYFLSLKAIERDDGILIISSNDEALLLVPEKATNFMEVYFYVDNQGMYFTNANRKYLSALIEEFLHTPFKERFPEKEYYLVANRDSLKRYGTNAMKYVNCIYNGSDKFSFEYGEPAKFSERELDNIKKLCPSIATAIDAMKIPVEDD